MKGCVHQGSALSPLLFLIAMNVLPGNVKNFSLMELLYVDDLALNWKSLDKVIEGWKRVLTGKRLRIHVKKIRGIQLLHSKITYVLKLDLFNVYGKQVGCKSIKCQIWVH